MFYPFHREIDLYQGKSEWKSFIENILEEKRLKKKFGKINEEIYGNKLEIISEIIKRKFCEWK